MAIYRGIVREIYEIAAWLPAGSTMTAFGTTSNVAEVDTQLTVDECNRFEFVGRVADERIRRRYIGRSVRDYFATGSQNPIKYAP
jgi:hypothetical protein